MHHARFAAFFACFTFCKILFRSFFDLQFLQPFFCSFSFLVFAFFFSVPFLHLFSSFGFFAFFFCRAVFDLPACSFRPLPPARRPGSTTPSQPMSLVTTASWTTATPCTTPPSGGTSTSSRSCCRSPPPSGKLPCARESASGLGTVQPVMSQMPAGARWGQGPGGGGGQRAGFRAAQSLITAQSLHNHCTIVRDCHSILHDLENCLLQYPPNMANLLGASLVVLLTDGWVQVRKPGERATCSPSRRAIVFRRRWSTGG